MFLRTLYCSLSAVRLSLSLTIDTHSVSLISGYWNRNNVLPTFNKVSQQVFGSVNRHPSLCIYHFFLIYVLWRYTYSSSYKFIYLLFIWFMWYYSNYIQLYVRTNLQVITIPRYYNNELVRLHCSNKMADGSHVCIYIVIISYAISKCLHFYKILCAYICIIKSAEWPVNINGQTEWMTHSAGTHSCSCSYGCWLLWIRSTKNQWMNESIILLSVAGGVVEWAAHRRQILAGAVASSSCSGSSSPS